MGVDLGDLAVKHTISVSSLSGKIVAIDAFNILYQFLASIRQEDGTLLMDYKGNPTAHLSGLFYRTSRFLENGLRPVYVFDGQPHVFKKRVQTERSEAKKVAQKKWEEAMEKGDLVSAKKYAQATARLTGPMIEESKKLLDAMGVPHIQAPRDGEAQAAIMVQKGLAYTTASQDYDALMFGSPILVRNLSISGRRKVPKQERYILVEPEQINLQETLTTLGLSREQIIYVGILLGTDFNQGVKRVGPKTALKIVKEKGTMEEIEKYVKEKYEYEFEVDVDEVIKLFMNPPYNEVKEKELRWKEPNMSAITKLLVEQHDFSADRIGKTVNDLTVLLKERGAQSKLEQWF
ncbi:flap endonuclease-1 [Candidatus Micrarchaeota archaeon]|nr:flap endonuclease-1 [Candidatus Micrarchaeota archaeon]